MPASPIVQTLLLLALLGCLLAFWKGEFPERIGAGIVLANIGLTLALGNTVSDDLGYLFGLALDGTTAIAFLVLTMFYGRLWLGAAMLIYAAQFGLRSYYLVTDRERDVLHAMVNNANLSAIILCIVVGTLVAWRRRVIAARR